MLIGERIRTLRKSAGLTQTELAIRAGLPRPNLSRIERGATDPRWSTVARIMTALRRTEQRPVEMPVLAAAQRREAARMRLARFDRRYSDPWARLDRRVAAGLDVADEVRVLSRGRP
jgi:transcriptional regulator with XRE-family HTH domain